MTSHLEAVEVESRAVTALVAWLRVPRAALDDDARGSLRAVIATNAGLDGLPTTGWEFATETRAGDGRWMQVWLRTGAVA